jgi:hypothetical protein
LVGIVSSARIICSIKLVLAHFPSWQKVVSITILSLFVYVSDDLKFRSIWPIFTKLETKFYQYHFRTTKHCIFFNLTGSAIIRWKICETISGRAVLSPFISYFYNEVFNTPWKEKYISQGSYLFRMLGLNIILFIFWEFYQHFLKL